MSQKHAATFTMQLKAMFAKEIIVQQENVTLQIWKELDLRLFPWTTWSRAPVPSHPFLHETCSD